METKLDFKSQVCTDKIQSEHLLALGLKKETADMVLLKEMVYDEENHCTRDGDNYLIRPIDYLEGEEHRGHTPAWSLHRLLSMLPDDAPKIFWILDGASITIEFEDDDSNFFPHKGDIYEGVVNCIEWLIKEGYFNKEYLV